MRTADSRTSPTPFARALFAGLPDRYDRLAAILSLGQDRRWRREMIIHALSTGPATVLDVATGPAGVALALAARSDAHVTGLDVSEDMLGRGRRNVDAAGRSSRISLVLGQGQRLPFPDATFDAVTFTYLLRYVADPAATIVELARVVRPGGTLASLEFAVPPNRLWRGAWWLYTRAILPVAGAVLGGRAWFDVGRFLGPSITAHYAGFPVAAHVAAWQHAGLDGIGMRPMSLGGGLVMWGRRTSTGDAVDPNRP
jgi:demethylmenaquinone methyltransferase / 2-methoxy-6-polyprenyl-1,4-benzoquinol methylase